jgi:hypothetical protein
MVGNAKRDNPARAVALRIRQKHMRIGYQSIAIMRFISATVCRKATTV